METQLVNTSRSSNAMMWIAGTAITVFCATGVAALMGWLPTSTGHPVAPAAVGATGTAAKPPVSAVKPALPITHTASASHGAPARVASAAVTAAKCAECGVIESVREIETRGDGTGIGAVGGAVVGGVLGHQVGGGRGKDIATVVGAVGGGLAGNEIEKRVKTAKSYDVTVRLDDGSSRVLHEANPPAWRAGDRVKVVDGAIRAN